ncbi:MAG: ATP synthase F0 subunit B [Desulfobacteraceae bacterium]|jgi:F-type H+-transporting ATPase subunit b
MDIYPNFTLVFQIANFLFLLFILNMILYRPIRKILGHRGDEVISFEEMIEDFQTRSTEGAKTLEENMADARSQGFKEKEGLKGAGMEEEKVMLQQAISSAEERIGKAKEEIDQDTAQARRSLEEEVRVFSAELAEKILGRSI